jgi:hypothetical protein
MFTAAQKFKNAHPQKIRAAAEAIVHVNLRFIV